jgi:hypothetical protein
VLTSRFPVAAALLAGVLCASLAVGPAVDAREDAEGDRLIASLKSGWPTVYARLVGLERAQGVFYGALASGKGTVVEADVLRRMLTRMTDLDAVASADPEADKGYAALGARGAEIVRRTHALHREMVAIFASVAPADRKQALNAAVDRYRSRPDVALSDVPKDMTVLYDHPYTSFVPPGPGEVEPRRKLPYPSLTGLVWASHWYQLAAQEPLERFGDAVERARGLEEVAGKFQRKLTAGALPDAFPTELPLAPSIAPGLVMASERAAAVIDNLNMMLDVIADTLVHPAVPDRRGAIAGVVARFTEREYRCVQADDWVTMALRHSIFQQGGPALGVMAANERNAGGHGQHFQREQKPASCDPP